MKIPTKKEMYSYYFQEPINKKFEKEIKHVKIKYFYFQDPIELNTRENTVFNFCILKGTSILLRDKRKFNLSQFDMVFVPEKDKIQIIPNSKDLYANKICLIEAPVLNKINENLNPQFEIKKFSFKNFIPRGEPGNSERLATYREVWTAFRNGYFMSGFTKIPKKVFGQGVITSVNLERSDNGKIKIYSHIHPDYPEIYIFCIDDDTKTIAVTQYLINSKGESVCMDLVDGDGLFFDGSLGHMNFIRPIYRELRYLMYMWIIPTFGKEQDIKPITLFTNLKKDI
ncbi:MAG: hypothetical protein ACTSWR_02095 [Candidatus Helarchaeota archaeon]